jgi:hypothetical protein
MKEVALLALRLSLLLVIHIGKSLLADITSHKLNLNLNTVIPRSYFVGDSER